ncbi:DUF4440 domain-containing protein [Burkholderia ubonensis]|uniref:DUF4440 domain-containing protein n=1 Tax=Burkholderia ubonensis subsp. mesacidophila TaxID=265293 RepID=A0A2A4FMQ3_9BURK|nr:DUF4440 domain-containing protein [Burkholderia ubonensis]PCE33904.1 DUF4440 domain-containing protein [Burkholderia ubonensis subsp. mesacidophila]
MNLSNPFFQEVVDAHVDIECWLSGDAEPGRLRSLLARFSPAFSMVALTGTLLDHAGVEALFARGHGARPGLRIEIDALTDIHTSRDFAVIGYRETQTDGEGRRTVRRSTAVFGRDAGGRIVWRHLQETPVAG